MKLSQALSVLRDPSRTGDPFRLYLNCGFTPLHLKTLLEAHVAQRLPGRKVAVEVGLFGDVAGNLERMMAGGQLPQGVALALEWPDFDSRLGWRSLGGWGISREADIVAETSRSAARLDGLLRRVAALGVPVAVSLPGLPLPPAFHNSGWEWSTAAALHARIGALAADWAQVPGVVLINPERLQGISPLASRLDLRGDIHAGFPYSLEHASAVGEALARLLVPAEPLKGLITDLDDTLWSGLVGEVGPEGVAWDLHGTHQLHGLYQQVLRALSEQGALLAIASKNSPEPVEGALGRADLVAPAAAFFPREVHWDAKSHSVGRILKTWNIAPDAVVFVDDSPIEVAEVQAAFPTMDCRLFPKADFAAAQALFYDLRDRFGKRQVREEDALRLESIRRSAEFSQQMDSSSGGADEGFLAGLEAQWTLHTNMLADGRALELINKTNQFNLNGKRFDPGAWNEFTSQPGAFVWVVEYQDKFGPLGKIAVLAGVDHGDRVSVASWVLSCRAFMRRIEFQMLAQLLAHYPGRRIDLDFAVTGRNQPFCAFLGELGAAAETAAETGPVALMAADCQPRFPLLAHNVTIHS